MSIAMTVLMRVYDANASRYYRYISIKTFKNLMVKYSTTRVLACAELLLTLLVYSECFSILTK